MHLTILIEEAYQDHIYRNFQIYESVYLEEGILSKILDTVKSKFNFNSENENNFDPSRRSFLKKAGLATIMAPVSINDFKNSLVNDFINLNKKYNPVYYLNHLPYEDIIIKKKYDNIFTPDYSDIVMHIYGNIHNVGRTFRNLRGLVSDFRLLKDTLTARNDPNLSSDQKTEIYAKNATKYMMKAPFRDLNTLSNDLNTINHFFIKPLAKVGNTIETTKIKPIRTTGRFIFGKNISHAPALKNLSDKIEKTTTNLSNFNYKVLNAIDSL